MREFLRRGGQDQRGLDDLARQVADKRRELLSKHNLDGTMQEVKELLDQAVLEERKQLARDVDLDDGDRALRRDAAGEPPAEHGSGGQASSASTTGRAPRPAPTTRRSRTCSAARCSTSASRA